MQRTKQALAFVAALFAGFGTLAVGTAPSVAQTAPTVSVEPATDLVDGSPVTVTVSGLVPRSTVIIGQCAATANSVFTDCDDVTEIDAADDGTVTRVLRADAVITTFAGPGQQQVTTDCREEACIVGVAGESSELSAHADLAFRPDGPLAPPPVATATPHDGLADLQTVTVTGSGFVWSDDVTVVQCVAGFVDGQDCDFGARASTSVSDAGTFETTTRALAVIDTFGDRGTVDCREPGACVLSVSSGGDAPEKSAVVPLTFDPDAEVSVPTILVTPDHDLVDGQSIGIAGSGFPAGATWSTVFVCGPDPSAPTCTELTTIDINSAGELVAEEVRIWAILEGPDGQIDCRTSAEPCRVVVTRGSPSSPRAARADVHFTPGGPIQPGPEITLNPSTNLPDDANVKVTGASFSPNGFAEVQVCVVGDPTKCDPAVDSFVEDIDDTGGFTTDIGVGVEFEAVDGGTVDCRVAPGCEVTALDFMRHRTARAGLAFAAATPPGTERYVDPVFDDVDVTENVVYRHTVDSRGLPVDLAVDIYQPAGDTAAKRPAVVWLDSGWFSTDEGGDMAAYARAYARRGYVAVTMQYRQRPELNCCSTRDIAGLTGAILDAYDDGLAGVAWLREHSADYQIDPDAIAAGGGAAGAITAWNLAQLPGQMDRTGGAAVAAAVSIGAAPVAKPDTGEAPVLAFHRTNDSRAPAVLSEYACAKAVALGIRCDVVDYQLGDGSFSPLETLRQRDIVHRSVDFLADVMLAPRGYVNRPAPPGPSPTTTSTTVVAGSPVSALHSQSGGSLPRTGVDTTMLLIRVGLILVAAGIAIVSLARRKGKRVEVAIFAVMALTIAAITGAFFVASDGDGGAELASATEGDGHANHHHVGDGSRHHEGTDHDSTDHDEGTHDDGHSHDDGTGSDDDGHSHDDGTGHDDGHSHDSSGSGHNHNGDSTGDHSHGDDPGAEHDHPAGEDPGHEHPPGDSDPGHDHPPGGGDPGHDHPPTDPPLPAEWTPEQRAYAQKLIDDTTVALQPYKNIGLLPLLGYMWIGDGTTPDTYQHWISTGRIGDNLPPLTPSQPESLVLRMDAEDGPVLEAAMYMLGLDAWDPSDPIGKVPGPIKYLPGWHVHENLCFEGFTLVGLAHKVNGEWVCDRGSIIITPPMLHTWIVPTVCGRFAGVDENGLQCDDHHHPS